jgi:hypothetical protein
LLIEHRLLFADQGVNSQAVTNDQRSDWQFQVVEPLPTHCFVHGAVIFFSTRLLLYKTCKEGAPIFLSAT